jgi:hypothetical protein
VSLIWEAARRLIRALLREVMGDRMGFTEEGDGCGWGGFMIGACVHRGLFGVFLY